MRETRKDWRLEAACHGQELGRWIPSGSGVDEDAKRICRNHCPVRSDCGWDAIRCEEEWSLAAGFDTRDFDERNNLRKFLGLPLVPKKKCTGCGEPFDGRVALCKDCRRQVPKGRTVEHVAELREAGHTLEAIADLAGLPTATLKTVVHGKYRAVSFDTARRIAAVKP